MAAPRILTAPHWFARRASQNLRPDAGTVSGGESLRRREQIIAGPSPFWRATFSLSVATDDGMENWTAFLARMRGRSRAVRIFPRARLRRELYLRMGASPPSGVGGVPHSSGAPFSNGVGYAWPIPTLTLAAPLAAFDNEATLDLAGHAPGLIVGDWIDISGARKIVAILEASPTQMVVEFEHPVTLPVAAGVAVSLNPSMVMQFSSDDEGALNRQASQLRTHVSVDLKQLPELA